MLDGEDLDLMFRWIMADRTWARFVEVLPQYDTPENRKDWDELKADVDALIARGLMPVAPGLTTGL
jgi:hypothetical protein